MLFDRMSSACINAGFALKTIGSSYLQSTALKKWWPWWLLLPGCLASWSKYVEDYDSIRVARCDARCGENHPDECMNNCLTSNYTKPGYCPDKAAMTPFEAACLIACIDDSRCPDLAKCCAHDCGVTCMHPVGLDNRTDLPPIPKNMQIRQQRANLALLTWHGGGKNSNERREKEYGGYDLRDQDRNRSDIGKNDVRYLIEERHLLGPRYLESRLTSWVVRHVSNSPHATLRGRLKTGHWYQFRVAAVNANGSRGYSQPSRPLKTKEPRNPKEPLNLTLSGARMLTGKLRINLHWTKPTSDVPITYYKIFWSRLIHGPANDSILVYHRTVLKDKTCYELKNLELECQYFLQVQAVALYGGRRLASRKASKVFNSTDYMAFADDVERRPRRCDRHRNELHVRRTSCHCGEVEARLVWPTSRNAKMYNVTWSEQQCPSSQQKNIASRRKLLWELVQAPRLDLRHLRRDCTYGVNVRNVYHDGNIEKHGSRLEFFAAGCGKEYLEGLAKRPRDKSLRCKVK